MQTTILLVLLIAYVSRALKPPMSRFANAPVTERFKWKYLDFAYSDEKSRLEDVESGDYIKENIIPVGVTSWKNRLFVTNPRWKLGMPKMDVSYLNSVHH